MTQTALSNTRLSEQLTWAAAGMIMRGQDNSAVLEAARRLSGRKAEMCDCAPPFVSKFCSFCGKPERP